MTLPSIPVVYFLFSLLAWQQSSPDLNSVVIKAFADNHDGYSSDEVLLNDELNKKFIADCQKQLSEIPAFNFNWKLINLRKAGKLSGVKTTRRNRASTTEYRMLAEVVARSRLDTEKVSIDRIFCEPKSRKAFDDKALAINPGADLYLVRKAAFQLRKARKLKPELITRIADWGRVISNFSLSKISTDNNLIPEQPGIYIFHDANGYLYIGQSENLRERLANHLDQSSNLELANYIEKSRLQKAFVEIHAFPNDSRAKDVIIRRAYESELIRSRKPKFNILP